MCSTTVLLLACLSADFARMTRWSLERARSCSALAYGSRSTAAATASAPSYTTSGDATTACSLARSLDIAGAWCTPLILRDIWMRRNRFDEFQDNLEVSGK